MTIKAHFDGKVFVPDEPVDIPSGRAFKLDLIEVPRKKKPTAREIADKLRKDTELHRIWNEIAAGRDSVEVANDLRRRASARRQSHDPD
ncbi:MAG TPA: hypothetical protein VG722_04240 [Tepidisphaeraceae bacterium]|nr:hypothetical protein [Tepidisphaeraceae bacterium]